MIDTGEGPLRWYTVFFSRGGTRGYRDVLAPSKRRAAWAVKFHPAALGIRRQGAPVIVSVVRSPRSRRRAFGRRPGPVGWLS